MFLACICGGTCEFAIITLIISGFAYLLRKIKNWKCCCSCHIDHTENKENKENIP